MLKPFLEIGKIVGTHGVKGELRVEPWCDDGLFFKAFKTLYYDARGERSVKVLSSRPHKNIVILKLENVDSVEQASSLRGKILFMNRKDARLKKGSYFIQDLIGCRVVDADSEDKCYGTICDVSETGANDVWHIKGEDGKEYLIPAIPLVVIETDVENEIVIIRPLKGIFDDEN